MEWQSGATELTFFHAFNSYDKVENSVIDYDVKNVHKVMSKRSALTGESVARKANLHYRDGLRHIKRAFGSRHTEDFQRYTWGLVLAIDLGLQVDKLELLTHVYCRKIHPRFIKSEYEKILTSHTTFRKIKDKNSKRSKWYELQASWDIHQHKLLHCPPTITKKNFEIILEVTSIRIDIDIDHLTNDIQEFDLDANTLHALLLDDPVINGTLITTSPLKSRSPSRGKTPPKPVTNLLTILPKVHATKSTKHVIDLVRVEKYNEVIQVEEETYGEMMRKKVEEDMKKEFEHHLNRKEERIRKFKKRIEDDKAARQAEHDENVARVQQIREDRLAAEEKQRELKLSKSASIEK